MIVAALLVFAVLLVAWILAPSGPATPAVESVAGPPEAAIARAA